LKTSLAVSAAALGVAVVAATSTGAAGSPGAHESACKVKSNLETIMDDSGSMLGNDPNRLRVQGINLVMNTPGNEGKTLGAVEFGTDAAPLFGPGRIGTNRNSFSATMDAKIQADNGLTNYNAAFDAASSHNPNADARIFLTDGDNTVGTYADRHKGGPPTYVVGFGSVSNDALLKRIASDTGGTYRKANDASELQAAINVVNTRINCQSPPKQYTDTFTKTGSKRHVLKIPRRVRSVFFALSWANPADAFDIGRFRLYRGNKLVSRSRVRKLRVRRRRGKTFVSVKVSGLRRGKLRFRVRAKRLSSTFGGVKLITQASRSRRR
jgi:von Willebrand factor type A domain